MNCTQLTILFASALSVVAQDLNVEAIFRRVRVSVGKVTAELPGNKISEGSSFVIGANLLATNYHVIECSRNAVVEIPGRGRLQVEGVIAFDRYSDWAILRIVGGGLPIPARGQPRDLRVGSPVIAVGYPLGQQTIDPTDGTFGPSPSRGEFQGLVPYRDARLIQHNAAISQGNSGGPLVDRNGRVIGMNTLEIPSGNDFYVAIDIALIEDGLRRSSSDIEPLETIASRYCGSTDQATAAPQGRPKGGASRGLVVGGVLAGAGAAVTMYLTNGESTNSTTDDEPTLVAQFSAPSLAGCNFNTHQIRVDKPENIEAILSGGGLADLDLYMFIGSCGGSAQYVNTRCGADMQIVQLGSCGVFQQSIGSRSNERIVATINPGTYTFMVMNLQGPTSGYTLEVRRRF